MKTPHRPARLLAAAFAAASCCAPLASHAAAVALTAFETLGSATGPGTDVMDGNANGGDFFRSSSSGANSSFFHTYGIPGGLSYFGARASGEGTFFLQTAATYTDSYTNTSGSVQNVTFAFDVDSGQIAMSGTGTGYADLRLQVMFGTTVVARDHGRIDVTAGGTTCNDNVSGDDVGALGSSYLVCDVGGAAAYGNSQSYSVSQLLGIGETLNVTYEILAETAGTMSGATGEHCSFGPEGRNTALGRDAGQPTIIDNGGEPRYVGCASFNGISRSGDPAGFNAFAPPRLTLTPSAVPVPEPGTLALAALALGGLLASRRRRG